jgi:hypothetical protein
MADALVNLFEWCKRERERLQMQREMLQSGRFRIHENDESGQRDISDQNIARRVRRSGRTRRRAIPRPRPTTGGSGTTNRAGRTRIDLAWCNSAPPARQPGSNAVPLQGSAWCWRSPAPGL